MLEMIYRLKKILENWSNFNKLSIYDIAKLIDKPVPYVWNNIYESCEIEIGVRDPIKKENLKQIIKTLIENSKKLIDKEQQKFDKKIQNSLDQYNVLYKKIKLFESKKMWLKSYKTIIYFIGNHEKTLSKDLLFELLAESLWTGFKANINLQELYHILYKMNIIADNNDMQLDLLDILDAYFDSFANQNLDLAYKNFSFITNKITENDKNKKNDIIKMVDYFNDKYLQTKKIVVNA